VEQLVDLKWLADESRAPSLMAWTASFRVPYPVTTMAMMSG